MVAEFLEKDLGIPEIAHHAGDEVEGPESAVENESVEPTEDSADSVAVLVKKKDSMAFSCRAKSIG